MSFRNIILPNACRSPSRASPLQMLRPAIELRPRRSRSCAAATSKSPAKSDSGDACLRHRWRMFHLSCRIALLGADSNVAAGDDLSLPPSGLRDRATPCSDWRNQCLPRARGGRRTEFSGQRPSSRPKKLELPKSDSVSHICVTRRLFVPLTPFLDDQPDLRHSPPFGLARSPSSLRRANSALSNSRMSSSDRANGMRR